MGGGLRDAPCPALGQLEGSPLEPSHHQEAPSPCVLEGLEVPYINDGLCDTYPMGCEQALPTRFQMLQGAPRSIHTSVLRNELCAESEILVPDQQRYHCTRCQTLFSPGCSFPSWILVGTVAASPQPSVSSSSPRPGPELSARRWPRQSRSSLSPPRRGERGEEIAADGAASAAGLGMTKFGSATCWLFFLLWRIRASRWSNSPREPKGIHPDLGDGHWRVGEREAGEQGGS